MLFRCKVIIVFLVSIDLFSRSCLGLENEIVKLTDEDFDEKTKGQEWSLVVFVKNWCTRSRKMANEVAKAANFLDNRDTYILWGKIDCENDGVKTCEKFSVSDVPALFLFKRGNYFKEFLSKPDYIGIIRFIKSETGPGYTIISNQQESDTFFESREVKIVGNFKQSDSALKTSLMNLVGEWKHHFDFGFYSDSMIQNEDEGIRLYRPKHLESKFEPYNVSYSGSDDVEELKQWIQEQKHGLVGHRNIYNVDDFKEPLVVVYFAVDYDNAAQLSRYVRNRVLKIARSHPQFTFAISAIKDFHKEIINFGYNYMKPTLTPVVCAYINGKRFPMREDYSVEEFSKFMVDLKDGKIEQHIRSEEIPESNELVKTAVAKNFDEVVNQSGRDTLIKFYASWCTWCKRLAPTWEKLAEAMKEEQVDIVKFNAENNELPPGYDVNQYPTLYWSPKNSKKSPVEYKGGKDLQDFIRYIAMHSTEDLNGFDRSGNSKPKVTVDKEL